MGDVIDIGGGRFASRGADRQSNLVKVNVPERERARAAAIRSRMRRGKGVMMTPLDAGRVAERMHELLKGLKSAESADRPGSRVTKREIAQRAWSHLDYQSATSRLRYFMRKPGQKGKAVMRHAGLYLPLIEVLSQVSGRSDDQLTIELFRDTSLDRSEALGASMDDFPELVEFVDRMRVECARMGRETGLPGHYRWVSRYGVTIGRWNQLFVNDCAAKEPESSDARGRPQRLLVPVASLIQEAEDAPPWLAGAAPSVPLFRRRYPDCLPVRLRVWFPGITEADLATTAHLREHARSSVTIDTSMVIYREVRLALAAADASASVAPIFESRIVPAFHVSDEVARQRLGANDLLALSPDDMLSGMAAADMPVGLESADGISWHAVDYLDPATNQPIPGPGADESGRWYGPDLPEGMTGAVVFEPFDFRHCYRYLIDWPDQYAGSVVSMLDESRDTDAVVALPPSSLGASLERHSLRDDDYSVFTRLRDDAAELVRIGQELRQELRDAASACRERHADRSVDEEFDGQ